jgi:hypothetical protein
VLLYRIVPHHPSAKRGAPGHPEYLHRPQGAGRWDNPAEFDVWYFSTSASGAVAEMFGNLGDWVDEMFDVPFLPAGRRALATFSVPDDLNILDLDDAATLLEVGLRPTQVVTRNSGFTQPFALRASRTLLSSGKRRWRGIRWWSFHRPHWTNVALWSSPGDPAPATLRRIDPLDISSPAVLDAAASLARVLPIPRQQPIPR